MQEKTKKIISCVLFFCWCISMEYAFGPHEYNDSTRCELDELWEDINNSDDTL